MYNYTNTYLGERTACMAIVDDDHFLHYYISLYNEEARALASSPSSSSSSSEYNNENIIIINNNTNNEKNVYHAKFSREYLMCQYQSLSLSTKSKRHHQHFHDHHHIGEFGVLSNSNSRSKDINDSINDECTTTSCTRSSISSSSSQPFSTTSSESDSDTNSDGQPDTQNKDKTDSDTNSDDNEHMKVATKIIYKADNAIEKEMFRLFNKFQDNVTVSFVTNPAVVDSLFINVNAYDDPAKLISLFKKLTGDLVFSNDLSYEEVKRLLSSDFPELPWMRDLYPVSLYEVLLARIELAMWASYYKVLEQHNFKLPQVVPGKAPGILSISKIKKDEENQDESSWMIMSKSPLIMLPSWSVMFATACSIEELRDTWEKLTPNIQKEILTKFPFVTMLYREALQNKAPLSFLERLVLCPLRFVCHDRATGIKYAYDYIGNYKTESTIPPPDNYYNTIDDIVQKPNETVSSNLNPTFKVKCMVKPPEVHPSIAGLKRIKTSAAEKEKMESEREEVSRVAAERKEAEKIEKERREFERAETLRIESERVEAERLAVEERRKKKIRDKKKRQMEAKRKREKEKKADDGVIDTINDVNNTLGMNTNKDHSSNDNNEQVHGVCIEENNHNDDDDHIITAEDHNVSGAITYEESNNSNGESFSKNSTKITYTFSELHSIREDVNYCNNEVHLEIESSEVPISDKSIDISDADDSFNSDYSHESNQNYQQLPNFHTTFYRNNNYDFRSLEKRLTRNIKNYNYIMNNRMEAHKLTRLAVTFELRSIVSSLWPQATVCVYGSCITGLALPTSDIDFVVKLSQHSNEFYNQQKYVPVYYLLNQQSSTTSSTSSSPLSVPPVESIALSSPDISHPEASHTFFQSIVGDIAERAYLEANPALLPGASLPKLPPRYLGHTNGNCPNQQEVLNALFALTAQLHMQHWTTSVNPIPTAAVPVVKMQVLPEHLVCLPHVQASVSSLYYEDSSYQKTEPPMIPFHLLHGVSIPVDISIEAGEHKGMSSCEFIQHALRMRSPVLASVVKVVKGLLQQAGYNMPFNGGLSSYSIFIMVCAIYDMEMICEIRRLAAKDTNNPHQVTEAHITQAANKLSEGTLFLNFLRFFSHYFDPSVAGIDITNPCIIFELSSDQRALIGTSAWISNPFDQSNIARPSFAFKQVQYLFGLMLHTFESNFRHMQLHQQQIHQQSTSNNTKSTSEYTDENIDFIRMYISF